MVALIDRVSTVLQDDLADFKSYLERIPGTKRITGFVVSSVFRGKDDALRQRLLWKLLEENLSDRDLQEVGPIVAMTPEEASLHQ